LQDLLDTTGAGCRDAYEPERIVTGLDIGTGCCSIYPILGVRTRPKWNFIATDIDDENIKNSTETVKTNKLESRIRIVKTSTDSDLISLNTLGVERLDFTMCNPPFYSSQDEMIASAKEKDRPPFSACTGAEIEMVTRGGEVSFVFRIITESIALQEKVLWYTSMLGKLSSVSALIERLIELGNTNYAVTEFVQGNKTRRWAIAWSWADRRPAVSVARGIQSPNYPKHLLPFPSEHTFSLPGRSIDEISSAINTELSSLHISWTWHSDLTAGIGFASTNVWSRQYRRAMKISSGVLDRDLDVDPNTAALGFRVQLAMGPDTVRTGDEIRTEKKNVKVLVRWLKGTDSVLFESFCGMVKRKLEGR
jgi:23S rRNA (adenine1618-N6)-methyltransferase